VSLGRVAQAKGLTKIYARPSTRSHVYYSVQPHDYLVVQDYSKVSPYKLVLLQNLRFGYALADSMDVLNYEYKVPASSAPVAMNTNPRATTLSSRNGAGLRAAVAQYSLNFKGTPYVWGGNDLKGEVDCSG